MYLTPKQRQDALANVPKEEISLEEFRAKYQVPLPPGKKPRKKSAKKPVQTFYQGKCELNKSLVNIGIDPDRDKSGIAVWQRAVGPQKGFFLCLETLTFFPLLELIEGAYSPDTTVIYLEAGWLNKKKNFHKDQGERRREKIAADVGANHEAGKKILEGLIRMGYTVMLVKPQSEKWDAYQFKLYTGLTYGYNEEIRDSAKYVFNS